MANPRLITSIAVSKPRNVRSQARSSGVPREACDSSPTRLAPVLTSLVVTAESRARVAELRDGIAAAEIAAARRSAGRRIAHVTARDARDACAVPAHRRLVGAIVVDDASDAGRVRGCTARRARANGNEAEALCFANAGAVAVSGGASVYRVGR